MDGPSQCRDLVFTAYIHGKEFGIAHNGPRRSQISNKCHERNALRHTISLRHGNEPQRWRGPCRKGIYCNDRSILCIKICTPVAIRAVQGEVAIKDFTVCMVVADKTLDGPPPMRQRTSAQIPSRRAGTWKLRYQVVRPLFLVGFCAQRRDLLLLTGLRHRQEGQREHRLTPELLAEPSLEPSLLALAD